MFKKNLVFGILIAALIVGVATTGTVQSCGWACSKTFKDPAQEIANNHDIPGTLKSKLQERLNKLTDRLDEVCYVCAS